MTKSICACTVVMLALSVSTELSSAGQSGTAAEAKAMLERAAAALKANEATALNEFNDKHDKRFHDRDLYVFCNSLSDGKMTAHPNRALIGTDAHAIRGDMLMLKIDDALKDLPEGSVGTIEYSYPRPGTIDPVPKESFIMRVGNQGCGVGYYK
jgi:cytochrome c